MAEAEAVLTYGMSGWPVWVHHAHRDQHWRVLEIIEPSTGPASPAGAGRYVLRVHGPLAYLPGREGRQYITAIWRDGRWWIEPNSTAYPRRGTRPGELHSSTGSEADAAACLPVRPSPRARHRGSQRPRGRGRPVHWPRTIADRPDERGPVIRVRLRAAVHRTAHSGVIATGPGERICTLDDRHDLDHRRHHGRYGRVAAAPVTGPGRRRLWGKTVHSTPGTRYRRDCKDK